jgi:hypothetical protein
MIVTFLSSLSQATLLYHRDTLNILSRFGREVSVTEQGRFVVDSIIPGVYSYPCTTEHKGIFFASLSMFPTCPCCPSWSIGSPKAFYRSYSYNLNFSEPLNLNDTEIFTKLDTSKTTSGCALPRAVGNAYLVFTNSTVGAKTTFLLVHVIKAYVDPLKPTQEGGGDLGYPRTTCNNMLIVEMYFQTDGSTNFKGAGFTSALSNQKISSINPVTRSQKEIRKWYDIQGNVVSDHNSRNMTEGCYLLKNGSSLKKQVCINHY